MRLSNCSTVWRPLILGVALSVSVLCGCRTGQRQDTQTAPTVQTRTEPAPQIVVERPFLAGLIESVSMYPVPNRSEDLAVSLIVSVGNTGSPSTVQGWNLEVNSPGRSIPNVEPVHVSGYVDMPGTRNRKIDLDKEDLVLKTARVPIAKGARIDGILTFVLSKMSESELSNNRSSFTIHFKDSQGNPSQTPKSVIGVKASTANKKNATP